MKILLDSGSPDLSNLGDIAMLQVAFARLRSLWPYAAIHVLTRTPERLEELCPGALPLSEDARRTWCAHGVLTGRLDRQLPKPVRWICQEIEAKLLTEWPRTCARITGWKLRRRGVDARALQCFVSTLLSAELVMAAGGGFINDIFRPHARRVLRTLATAQAAGALTALVGQGIGPLTDRALRKQVASVLPKLDLFTLREDGVSSSLLRGLKVPADRIDITGDDAIELAYLQRSRRLGQSIGVNIRAAQYANISAHAVTVIQQTLRVISGRLSATLVPVPILIGRHHSTPPDAIAIAEIVRNSVNLPDLPDPTAPVDAIRRVNHCRIVVTGSYHAAVFALSQGRPAVCLAGSQYYMDKFAGLARAFGAGCEVVALEAPDLASRLAASLESAWHAAERMQPLLLAAAERQINRGMSAYGRLFALAKSVHKQIDACAEAAVCTATVQINADVAGK